MEAATQPAVGPRNHVLPSHQVSVSHQAVRQQFRVLNEVGGVGYDTRDQNLALRELHVLPHLPLVLVAHVSSLDGEGLGMDLQYHVYGILQRDIYGMGALPTAPAHMVPHPVLRNASEGVIEGVNTQLSLPGGTPQG
jgi:hypothetical protein